MFNAATRTDGNMSGERQNVSTIELEAEIIALQQEVHDAQNAMAKQQKKIRSGNLRLQKEKKVQLNSSVGTFLSSTGKNDDITLQYITKLLYDYICENKKERLDKYLKAETILSEKMSQNNVTGDVQTIVDGVSWIKGVLIANWRKNSEPDQDFPSFEKLLPAFFRALSAWPHASALVRDEPTELCLLKYNPNAYKFLYTELVPRFISKQCHSKQDIKLLRLAAIKCLMKEILHAVQLDAVRQKEEKSQQELLISKEQNDSQQKEKEIQEENRQRAESWLDFYTELKSHVAKHAPALMRNLRKSYVKNDYGAVETDERESEIFRFIDSVGLYDHEKFDAYCLHKANSLLKRWYARQEHTFDHSDTVPENGHDFEHWVAAKLKDAGWKSSVTQASGDDGVDVIAEHDGVSVAVQCKRFSGSVGNKAVQEVYSGMKHMQLDRAVVISTGQYTKTAKNLARTTGVLLLNEHDISHLWDLLKN